MPTDLPSTLQKRWKAAVIRLKGDVCWICGHGGATSADHVIPRAERPDLQYDVANGKPAHGAPHPCRICSAAAGRDINCNNLRLNGSVEYARSKIKKLTGGMAFPFESRSEGMPGRDW